MIRTWLKTKQLKKENEKLKEELEIQKKKKEELEKEQERLEQRKQELEQMLNMQREYRRLIDNLIEYLKLYGRECKDDFPEIPYYHNIRKTPEGGVMEEVIIPSIKVGRYDNPAF